MILTQLDRPLPLDRSDAGESMIAEEENRSQVSMAFEAYWRTLLQTKSPPSYNSFDPLEVPEMVPNLTILKITKSPTIKMSLLLYGSGLRDRTKYEATGDDVTDFFEPEERASYMKRLQAMHDKPCGIFQFVNLSYANGSSVKSETTSFPLAGKTSDEFYVVSLSNRPEHAPLEADRQLVHVESSNHFEFLDVGFGVIDNSELY